MRYKQIHFHLDYVEKYNLMLAGIEELPKMGKTRNLGLLEKAKNEHETKAAVLLHDGIKKGHGGRGLADRAPISRPSCPLHMPPNLSSLAPQISRGPRAVQAQLA